MYKKKQHLWQDSDSSKVVYVQHVHYNFWFHNHFWSCCIQHQQHCDIKFLIWLLVRKQINIFFYCCWTKNLQHSAIRLIDTDRKRAWVAMTWQYSLAHCSGRPTTPSETPPDSPIRSDLFPALAAFERAHIPPSSVTVEQTFGCFSPCLGRIPNVNCQGHNIYSYSHPCLFLPPCYQNILKIHIIW